MTNGEEPGADLVRDPAVIDHAEQIAGLGSWEWIPATSTLIWSDNMFRLYGVGVRTIVPTPEFVTRRVHPDDLGTVLATLDSLRAGEARSVEYRFRRDDGRTIFLRATVAIMAESQAGHRHIVGSVLDVTAQRSLEREISARLVVTEMLDEWENFEEGAPELLRGLATVMGCVFGALWTREQDAFVARAMWHSDSAELDRLSAVTARWYPGLGAPTVGKAFSTRRPTVISDLLASAPRDRAAALRQADLSTALLVPAVFENATIAVLELLSVDPLDLTDRLMRSLYGIGHEIGYFFAGRRGDLTDSSLSPRAREVLQLAADGLNSEAIAAQVGVSPATIKRHFERAYLQLGVSDRAAAVAEAMRRGLID